MLGSQFKGKPHDCSGPFNSRSLCICQLWETGAETHRQHRAGLTDARHTLQAERAVELHRPRARPLTLCLLRMKREDFITSWRPRLRPSSLPPPKSSLPPCSPPLLPVYLPVSLPHSQPVACSRACPSQEWGSSLPKKTSHPIACLCCAVYREGATERRQRQRDGIYGSESTNSYLYVLKVYIEGTASELFSVAVLPEKHSKYTKD